MDGILTIGKNTERKAADMDCDITEKELTGLIAKYTKCLSEKLASRFHRSGNILTDEIKGILGETAVKAINKYKQSNNHRAKLKTYIIQSFKNAIIDYQRKIIREQNRMNVAMRNLNENNLK